MRLIAIVLMLAACLAPPTFAAEPTEATTTISESSALLSKSLKLEVKWEAPYGAGVIIPVDQKSMTIDELSSGTENLEPWRVG